MIDVKKKSTFLFIVADKYDENVYVKNTLINTYGKSMSSVNVLDKEFYNMLLNDSKKLSTDNIIKNWDVEYVYDYELDKNLRELNRPLKVSEFMRHVDVVALGYIVRMVNKELKQQLEGIEFHLEIDKHIKLKAYCPPDKSLDETSLQIIEFVLNSSLNSVGATEVIFKLYDYINEDNCYVFNTYSKDANERDEIEDLVINKNSEERVRNFNEFLSYAYANDSTIFENISYSATDVTKVYPGIGAGVKDYMLFIEYLVGVIHNGEVKTKLMNKKVSKEEGVKFSFKIFDNLNFQPFLVNDGDLLISQVIDRKTNKIVAVNSNYIRTSEKGVELVNDTDYNYLMYLFDNKKSVNS